ncbi:hypothetical protein U2G91_15630 [Rhodococcoides fascians]|uniref:hypothetical protein n=1 Tax=Rhodococcoides fascians TaxID=1828 RepID=UPI002ACD8B5C|nr:hypothetical protein [Rhodococcus fascians]WQH26533.1 hypothetical protein U2G91_15630 [Rhodococcus fascians]
MLVYATTAQYEALTGDTPPDNFSTLNRYAAGLVREATLCDRWVPLPSGLPVDDDLREALSDAACEQIASWNAAGIDPQKGAGGQAVQVSATSIDGASLSYDVASGAEARAQATRSLCDAALMHLRNAGLGSTVVAGR